MLEYGLIHLKWCKIPTELAQCRSFAKLQIGWKYESNQMKIASYTRANFPEIFIIEMWLFEWISDWASNEIQTILRDPFECIASVKW